MQKNGMVYEGIMMGFYYAVWVLRQRPQINGVEYLKNLPSQVIFTITHDSYFEIPSLSRVYKAITPRPVFTIMAKEEFLDGQYLSTNFFKDNPVLRSLFKFIDSTGAPKAIFEKLNLISIPRPFADIHDPRYKNVKMQISSQFHQFKTRISEGFSTLIFPEGTTWGYGGLRKIRSAVFQLVSTSFEQYDKKVYILPINVKVDKLVKGWKDVFINVGKPQFFFKSKDEFNQQLYTVLQRLHTITFSQIGAYYLKKLSKMSDQARTDLKLSRDQLFERLEQAAFNLQVKVQKGTLPAIDQNLMEKDYFSNKFDRFLAYCARKNYLDLISNRQEFVLNAKKILAHHPHKIFRKRNPLGFHANELASLGEKTIDIAFEK
ncbi:1-acyl-sn-glycerol-3-phosphate acyltransferase [bacterium]|nr:1-acyl-sn-glycerol-3-phosphate acyltransferase [bacterium]